MTEQQFMAHWALVAIGMLSAAFIPPIENKAVKIALAVFALICVLPVFLRLWVFAVLG